MEKFKKMSVKEADQNVLAFFFFIAAQKAIEIYEKFGKKERNEIIALKDTKEIPSVDVIVSLKKFINSVKKYQKETGAELQISEPFNEWKSKTSDYKYR